MKLFPYILARVAGLPYSAIHAISWREENLINDYLKQKNKLEIEKRELINSLESLINKLEDYPTKYFLKIIRRSVFNDRKIKLKAFDYKGVLISEFEKVLVAVEEYKSSKANLELVFLAFTEKYNHSLLISRQQLVQYSQESNLLFGLQLASHSFIKQLEKYQVKALTQLNKKPLQTEKKLLQYLTRIATKTSPFSSFTKLALLDLNGRVQNKDQRKVRLNNSLFRLFRDALIHYQPFYRNLPIRLNPTMDQRGEQYVYLLNTLNIESVQRMDQDELTTFIIQLLSRNRQFNFNEFIDELLVSIEAERAAIENHIIQLIEYGLIEWEWPISGLDAQWLEGLKALLGNSTDELLIKTFRVLNEVETHVLAFEEGDFEKRKKAQESAYTKLAKISEILLIASNLKDKTQEITSRDLRNVLTTSFNLKVEKVFFEDVSQAEFSSEIKEDIFQKISKELDQLTKNLDPLFYNSSKEKHLYFFKKHYSDGRIPLLEYYEAYFKNPVKTVSHSDVDVKRQETFFNQLIQHGKRKSKSCFHLDWSAFSKVEDLPEEVHRSKGALIQIISEGDKAQAYVDAIFMGYGKFFGRFLHLFPDQVTESIRANNIAIQADQIWLENMDASIFNPNVHPPLLVHEVQSSNSQNNLPSNQNIQISDLEIGQVSGQKYLGLFYRPTAQRVHIFDFGFEALDNRSPMYRLLSIFNYQLTGPSVLVGMLEDYLKEKDQEGVIIWPRVTVGEHLILKRKGWGIPKDHLPFKAKNISDAAYFLAVNEWKIKYELPNHVFIIIDPKEFRDANAGRPRTDDYKPQFMDFNSPLLVQLFGKLLLRVPTILKITETLPKVGAEGNAVEYLVEWEGSQEELRG